MSSARPISASDYALLALALAISAVVLCFRLNWLAYGWDEYVTLMFTRMSWPELIIENWGVDTHRPAYYGLQKAWNGVFGESVAAVRALPVVLTLLMIAVFFAIGRRIGPTGVGGLTALLLASAPIVLHYGRLPRMYALAHLALALALWIAVILAQRAQSDRRAGNGLLWLGLAVAMAGAFYAQALAVFVALLFGLWVLIVTGAGLLPRWFLGQALVAGFLFSLLILPGLPPFFAHASQTLGDNFWVPDITLRQVYEQTAAAYAYPKWIKPVVALLLLWGLWCLRRRPVEGWLLGAMVAGLPLLVLLISFWKPLYVMKVIAWGSIVSVLVLAIGLMALPRLLRWSGFAILISAQLWAAWHAYPDTPQTSPYKGISDRLMSDFDPEADILVFGPLPIEAPLRWYADPVFASPRIYAFTYGDTMNYVINAAFRSQHVLRKNAGTIPLDGGRLFVLWETSTNLAMWSFWQGVDLGEDDLLDDAIAEITTGKPLLYSEEHGNLRLDVYDLE